jgi:hypothetical protein
MLDEMLELFSYNRWAHLFTYVYESSRAAASSSAATR